MVSLALEVQHGVDQVLEHARAGQRPFLGDVPDQEGGDALSLREQHQARPAFADLADAARRGLEAGQVDGLDGVHHQDARAQRLHVAQDDLEVVLGHEVEARGRDPEPLGPELDLSGRLLARDVEHRAGALRQRASRLQEQGGLADPRIAADQDQRVLDQASSQHPVQLADPRRDALAAIAVDRRQGQRPAPGRRHHAHPRAGGGRPLLDELHVAARAGAVRTGPRLGRREPALLAAVHRALARHHARSVIWPGPPRPPRLRCSSGSARAADSSASRRRGPAPGSRTPWGLRARRRSSPDRP